MCLAKGTGAHIFRRAHARLIARGMCSIVLVCLARPAIAAISCDVLVTKLDNARTEIIRISKEVPFQKSTPTDTILYEWGPSKITANVYAEGDLGIVWEEKPFGFRSGTFETTLTPQRHFFIEDFNAGIGVDVHCRREEK
jgi:hypothetical protein